MERGGWGGRTVVVGVAPETHLVGFRPSFSSLMLSFFTLPFLFLASTLSQSRSSTPGYVRPFFCQFFLLFPLVWPGHRRQSSPATASGTFLG